MYALFAYVALVGRIMPIKFRKRYCKFKENALDRSAWRTRFERGHGGVEIPPDFDYEEPQPFEKRSRARRRS